MANYDNKKSMLRYAFLSVIMAAMAVAVIGKAFYTASIGRQYWLDVQKQVKKDSVVVPATRGNILSSGGQQLSCNLPEYRIYMDFVTLKQTKNDTLWYDSLKRETKEFRILCQELHKIFPSRSEQAFRDSLAKGFRLESRAWPVWNQRIDYITYKRVKGLPLFNLRKWSGGFYEEQLMTRSRPYGSLALSVIGTTYKENVKFANGVEKKKGTPKSGLEMTFDTLLRGKPGIIHRRKVLNSWVSLSDTLPVDGLDLVTSIDVGIQDLAERSLIKQLKEIDGPKGVAIVMEVKTGDIKAMVSLDRADDGTYHESEFNHAISDLPEPGSVFKTASFMVAIEDGYIRDTARTFVDTGNGVMLMHGSPMRDHNWRNKGYGVINVPRILQVSSNIGVSYLIDKYYASQPEKYVDGILKTGIGTDLNLPFVGYKAPLIRRPVRNEKGRIVGTEYPGIRRSSLEWYKTTLPWMSIGYETKVPPISVLTFYNAIANNGRMVKPRFVTRAEKDGVVVQEYPTEVVKEHICSDNTLHIMQDMLEKVVSEGLGKLAGSKAFRVAGKTGTALIASNGGYKSGKRSYWLSFAGYFPYDDPKYSCIVCVEYVGPSPSGGRISGSVFHEISEGIYAHDIKYDAASIRDSLSIFMPEVKSGNILAADYVLSHLNLQTNGGWNGSYAGGNPIWGTANRSKTEVRLTKQPVMQNGFMPDVLGMGARDAVFMLESRGVKVRLQGRGKVKAQSCPAGSKLVKGQRITLELS